MSPCFLISKLHYYYLLFIEIGTNYFSKANRKYSIMTVNIELIFFSYGNKKKQEK